MRFKATRKKGGVRIKLLIPLFLLLVLSFLFLIVQFDLLTVRKVSLSLDRVDCASADEIKETANLLGQNFIRLDERVTTKKLQEKFFCISKVNLSKELPNKVIMNVSGRRAAAVLASFKVEEASSSAVLIATSSASPSKQFLVDVEGVIFSDKTAPNLPTLYFGSDDLKLGQKLPPGLIRSSLDVLAKLKTFGLEVKEAKIDQQKYLLVSTNDGTAIIFELNEKIDYQLAALQLIVTQAKINDEKMQFIDTRFDKPIVKYAPKKK